MANYLSETLNKTIFENGFTEDQESKFTELIDNFNNSGVTRLIVIGAPYHIANGFKDNDKKKVLKCVVEDGSPIIRFTKISKFKNDLKKATIFLERKKVYGGNTNTFNIIKNNFLKFFQGFGDETQIIFLRNFKKNGTLIKPSWVMGKSKDGEIVADIGSAQFGFISTKNGTKLMEVGSGEQPPAWNFDNEIKETFITDAAKKIKDAYDSFERRYELTKGYATGKWRSSQVDDLVEKLNNAVKDLFGIDDQHKIEISILPQKDEGNLAAEGTAQALTGIIHGKIAVLEIGSGSTQLTYPTKIDITKDSRNREIEIKNQLHSDDRSLKDIYSQDTAKARGKTRITIIKGGRKRTRRKKKKRTKKGKKARSKRKTRAKTKRKRTRKRKTRRKRRKR